MAIVKEKSNPTNASVNSSMKMVLLIFCAILYVYQYAVKAAIPNVLNAELINYFSIDASSFGMLLSAFYIMYTSMQIPVGVIIDRVNPKILFFSSFMLISVSLMLFVATRNIVVGSIFQMFLGVGCSFGFVLVLKVINNNYPQSRVAFVTSIIISLGCAGPALLNFLLTYLSEQFYWRSVVISVALVGVIVSFLGAFFIKTHKIRPSAKKEDEQPEQLKIQMASIKRSVFEALSKRQIILIGIFSTTALSPIVAFSETWGMSFLRAVYGFDKMHASIANNMIFFGIICGGPIFGYVSSKMMNYKKPMILGSIAMLALFAVIVFCDIPFPLLCITTFLLGFASACQLLSFPAAMALASKKNAATVVGVVNTITMAGISVLTPLIGEIIDYSSSHSGTYSSNDYKNAMMSGLVFILVSNIVAFYLKDTKKTKPEPIDTEELQSNHAN